MEYLEIIYTSVGILAAIVTIAAACVGLHLMRTFKQKKTDAAFGFFTGLLTHLSWFYKYIERDDEGAAPEWLKYLGESNKNLIEKNKNATAAREHAENILNFICDGENQIPLADDEKNSKADWKKAMDVLKKRLIEISLASADMVFSDWSESKEAAFNNTYEEFVWAIKHIQVAIEDYLKDI